MKSWHKKGQENLRQWISEPALVGSRHSWSIMKNLHAKWRKSYSPGLNNWPAQNHS